MGQLLDKLQIIVSLILVGLILLQQKAGGLGSVFGSENLVFGTSRGVGKIVQNLTILFLSIIIIISLLRLRIA